MMCTYNSKTRARAHGEARQGLRVQERVQGREPELLRGARDLRLRGLAHAHVHLQRAAVGRRELRRRAHRHHLRARAQRGLWLVGWELVATRR